MSSAPRHDPPTAQPPSPDHWVIWQDCDGYGRIFEPVEFTVLPGSAGFGVPAPAFPTAQHARAAIREAQRLSSSINTKPAESR